GAGPSGGATGRLRGAAAPPRARDAAPAPSAAGAPGHVQRPSYPSRSVFRLVVTHPSLLNLVVGTESGANGPALCAYNSSPPTLYSTQLFWRALPPRPAGYWRWHRAGAWPTRR